jgi:hypothetical protein
MKEESCCTGGLEPAGAAVHSAFTESTLHVRYHKQIATRRAAVVQIPSPSLWLWPIRCHNRLSRTTMQNRVQEIAHGMDRYSL